VKAIETHELTLFFALSTSGIIEESDVEISLKQYLVGDQSIAGLLLSDTGEKVSIYDACKRNLIGQGITMCLKICRLLC